ncbi:BMP family ABC transporter substrate-binding protein [Planotetraspora sp. A-T 1434]|uniref:BMP family ABC transporter substrate-binding protein n=1 Tax=Planotetraspora sp. A-T 1434 TaxID=2979219 RepID=UPI0021BFE395|nr:BMP family ABC transporter substrate-binding protein [Planotetraspora sp. A-T 1434]MCT9934882.1 BMP family ABC transporter substrate-binding protein [Planotetraspora sp. A-T 1434]
MPDLYPLLSGEPDQFGDYRVLGRIGQGGQGTVYLAESPSGERVAIKVLHAHQAVDENARRRFVREVTTARQVATFSTARVIDVSTEGQRPYIVSEYVEGVSLEQRVRERGPLTGDELVRLALGTAGALAAIHQAGVVHRDFKPSNVLLGPDGPRVIDFGIARALDSFTATTSGVAGTPAYMAPEQIANEQAGPPADVFSWAVTMIFAATGRLAFGGTSVPAVLHAVLTTEPDMSGVPESLRSLLGKCLAKAPQDRPAAAEIMLQLVGHGTGRPPGATTGEPTGAPPPPTSAVSASTHELVPQPVARTAPGTAGDSPRAGRTRRSASRAAVPLLSVLLALVVTGGIWLRSSLTDSASTSTASHTTPSSRVKPSPAIVNNLDKVGIAFDVGGRGDMWFNDSAAQGLERAKRELGVRDPKELAASAGETDEQRKQRLRVLARSGHNPIIAIGFPYSEAVTSVAAEFPDTRFAIVDSEDATGKNVSNLVFAEQEGGFLAGAAAALSSKKGHVGFIGAVKDGANIERAAAGFVAGAKSVKASIRIDVKYLSRSPDFSGYDDPAKGKLIATGMFDAGADVLFQAAGGSNLGVMQAAKAAGGQVIGAEGDEARTADATLRDVVLTSVINRVDTVVFDFLKAFSTSSAKPGPTVHGIKDNGIDYTTTGNRIEGIKTRLEEVKQEIANGEIVITSS